MKQVFTINISGQFFRIDSEAYARLKSFIANYASSIENEEEKEKLTQQMENNLANELSKRCNNNDCIIDIQIIKTVIENIGGNEANNYEFDKNSTQNSASDQNSNKYTKVNNNEAKRLFRDANSRVIGGVCSGLANFFNIDKALVRLLFIILFFITAGFALLLYIILWIAAPLSFESNNIHNENQEKNKQRHEKKYEHHRYDQNYPPKSDNILARIFGLILMLFGFLILSAIITAVVFGSRILGFVPAFSDGLILNHIVSESFGPTIVLAIFLITAIPILLLIYAGTKLLFNYVANSRAVFLTALTTWIIAIIVSGGMISGIFNDFKTTNSLTEQHTISNIGNTLYVKINDSNPTNFSNIKFEVNNYKIAIIDNKELIIARPKLIVKKSDTEQTFIESKKSARGKNLKRASFEAETIIHQFNINGDTLIIDPYFTLEKEHKWRQQSVELSIELPKGKTLYLDQNLLPILYKANNEQNLWEPDMTGQYWKMGDKKLSIAQE